MSSAPNVLELAWRLDPRTGRLVVMSAEDNIVKGASGQAVQSLKHPLRLPENGGADIGVFRVPRFEFRVSGFEFRVSSSEFGVRRPGFGNSQPETRNPKPENSEPGTRKPGTRNSEPENPDLTGPAVCPSRTTRAALVRCAS
jgi:hypothetical protein